MIDERALQRQIDDLRAENHALRLQVERAKRHIQAIKAELTFELLEVEARDWECVEAGLREIIEATPSDLDLLALEHGDGGQND